MAFWVLLGVWDQVQSQLLSEDWQNKTPSFLDVIVDRPWYVWVIGALVTLLLLTLEGAHGEAKRSGAGEFGAIEARATNAEQKALVAAEALDEYRKNSTEFYAYRPPFDWYRNQLASAKTSWVVWNAGGIAVDYEIFRGPHPNRVILPLPDPDANPMIQYVAAAGNMTSDDLVHEIRKTTKKAKAVGVEVRWWTGWLGNVVTIGDPDSPSAWVLVETLIPFAPADQRPLYRIERSQHPKLYDWVIHAYEEMWEASEEANSQSVNPQA